MLIKINVFYELYLEYFRLKTLIQRWQLKLKVNYRYEINSLHLGEFQETWPKGYKNKFFPLVKSVMIPKNH